MEREIKLPMIIVGQQCKNDIESINTFKDPELHFYRTIIKYIILGEDDNHILLHDI
jgi:hypothetical protein